MDSRSDPDPLKVVLLQEVERYNQMLTFVHGTLRDLEKAMQGLVSVTALLDVIVEALMEFKVPGPWGTAYPSIKGLMPWVRDLIVRCDQLTDWWTSEIPKVTFTVPESNWTRAFLVLLTSTHTHTHTHAPSFTRTHSLTHSLSATHSLSRSRHPPLLRWSGFPG